jgi:hypothetical protein
MIASPGGENDAKRSCGQSSDQNRPRALSRGQASDGKADDNGIVACQYR